MKALLPIALVATVLVALAGCQQSLEKKLIGTWTGSGSGLQAGQADLVLKEDKTFTLGAGQGSTAGKWSLAEKTVTLATETVGGKPKEEALKEIESRMGQVPPEYRAKMDEAMAEAKKLLEGMKLTASDDGKTLTANIKGANGLTFTKK